MAEKAVNGADTSPEEAMAKSAPQRVRRRIQVRRSGVHGKGVFAVQDIAEGETIIEYVGEVINWKEAQRRHPHDPKDPNHTFYFHVDENRVIDAKVGGNSVALDQPLVRPELRGRRGGRPGLHQGPAQHQGRAKSSTTTTA